MYPQKINDSVLDKQAKAFVLHTAECEYQLDFRTKDENKPLRVATIHRPTQDKNQKVIRKLEKDA